MISRTTCSSCRAEYLAHRDPLTGLPNRTLFEELLKHAVMQAEHNGHTLALLLLDLDRFKNINDSLGHSLGDQLLAALAKRLRAALPNVETIARIGGDELTLMIEPEGLDRLGVDLLAQRTIEIINQPVALAGQEIYTGVSIGIALYPDDGDDAETLLSHADAALHRAKDQGGNQMCFFAPELGQRAHARLRLEADLRRAIDQDQLRLHYQPQLSLQTGALAGLEALVRWEHPEQGLISPGAFIPIAEESGLIVPLGDWVLNAACRNVIIALGHTLGLEVLAEGVEREEQADYLRAHHCDLMQGYLIARPLPPEAILAFVKDRS